MKNKSMLSPIVPNVFLRNLAWLIVGLMLAALTACATGQTLIDHAFSFDARTDSPDAKVLDYQYGDSKIFAARAKESDVMKEDVRQSISINGPMLLGDFLYVKWRIKSMNMEYQDTINLKTCLPSNIVDHRIHFMIKGSQLYVYLISPEKLNPNPCPSHDELRRLGKSDAPGDKIFSMYCYRKIITIYPDQPKF